VKFREFSRFFKISMISTSAHKGFSVLTRFQVYLFIIVDYYSLFIICLLIYLFIIYYYSFVD